MRSKGDQLEAEIAGLKKTIRGLNADVEEIQQLRAAVTRIREKRNELQTAVLHLNTRVAELVGEATILRETLGAVVIERDTAQTNLANARHSNYVEGHAALQKQVDDLRELQSTLMLRVYTVESEKTEVENQHTTLNEEILALQKEVGDLQAAAQQGNTEHEQEILDKNTQIATVESKYSLRSECYRALKKNTRILRQTRSRQSTLRSRRLRSSMDRTQHTKRRLQISARRSRFCNAMSGCKASRLRPACPACWFLRGLHSWTP